MYNNDLETLRSKFMELKQAQINLLNSIQEDKEEKSKLELATCLQEVEKCKAILNQEKTVLEEDKPCDPCEKELEKIKNELEILKKTIADSKQEETNLEKGDKETTDQGKDKNGYDNYQETVLALLNKLLEKKKKESENKRDEDTTNNEDSKVKDKQNETNNQNKVNGNGDADNVAEGNCVNNIKIFKERVRQINDSNDPITIKLQNLKNLLTSFDDESDVPKPEQT